MMVLSEIWSVYALPRHLSKDRLASRARCVEMMEGVHNDVNYRLGLRLGHIVGAVIDEEGECHDITRSSEVFYNCQGYAKHA